MVRSTDGLTTAAARVWSPGANRRRVDSCAAARGQAPTNCNARRATLRTNGCPTSRRDVSTAILTAKGNSAAGCNDDRAAGCDRS